MRTFLALAGLFWLAGCAGTPTEQPVRVQVVPDDASCVLRSGDREIQLVPPERQATVAVTLASLVVNCRRTGFEDSTVRKYPLHRSSAPGAGPLLLLMDSGTFKGDSYPAVIHVDMVRR